MASILYTYGNDLYVNLTNRCPCSCTFCIRAEQEGVGSADSLWLEEEPSATQVIEHLVGRNLKEYGELVFCGYGEPFSALDVMLEVCRYVRGVSDIKIRVNTNGLGDLIAGKPTAPLLKGMVDVVSISLNAPGPQRYAELCRPVFALDAYPALLRFIGDCKRFVPEVKLSVVDVIPSDEIEECRAIAEDFRLPLRVRHYS